MSTLVPVDYDPFAGPESAPPRPSPGGSRLTPVNYDPFERGAPGGTSAPARVGRNLAEVPGGIAAGVVESGATALKGVSAIRDKWGPAYAELLGEIEEIDVEGAQVSDLQPQFERGPEDTGGAARTLTAIRRADEQTPLAGLAERIRLSSIPIGEKNRLTKALTARISGEGADEALADARSAIPTPIRERELWKAGESVSEFAQETYPAAEGYEASLGRQVGIGLGSLGAGIAASVAGGPIAGGALFTAMGAGEAADRAAEAGASDADIARAASLGLAAGTTDIAPVEALLGRLPVPGARAVSQAVRRFGGHRTARAMGRIGGQAALEAVQEGGQQALQNLIAREVHSPETVIMEGVEAGAGLGGIVGGIAGLTREGIVGMAGRRSTSLRGERARAVQEVPPPTPQDEASPIPTEDIMAGREEIADGQAAQEIDAWAATEGLPEIGQPVRLVRGGQPALEGVVTDAWRDADPGLSITDADGNAHDITLEEIARSGHEVVGLPMPPSAEEVEARRADLETQAQQDEAAQRKVDEASAAEQQAIEDRIAKGRQRAAADRQKAAERAAEEQERQDADTGLDAERAADAVQAVEEPGGVSPPLAQTARRPGAPDAAPNGAAVDRAGVPDAAPEPVAAPPADVAGVGQPPVQQAQRDVRQDTLPESVPPVEREGEPRPASPAAPPTAAESAAALEQPAPILSATGQPYKTAKSAQAAAQSRGLDATPVAVEGGFGLQAAQEETVEVEQARLQRDARSPQGVLAALEQESAPSDTWNPKRGSVRVYHGAPLEAAEEINRSGFNTPVAFVTPNEDVAQEYADYSEDGEVVELSVDPDELLIDFDLPAQRVLTVEEANDYQGTPGKTIWDYIDEGQSLAIRRPDEQPEPMLRALQSPEGALFQRGRRKQRGAPEGGYPHRAPPPIEPPAPSEANRRRVDQVYALGKKHEGESEREIVEGYDYPLSFFVPGTVAHAAFRAGRTGKPKPRWVAAWRYGKPPEPENEFMRGLRRSTNARDQEPEPGVSVMEVFGGDRSLRTLDSVSAALIQRRGARRYLAGWLSGSYGADGEPLLVGMRDLGPARGTSEVRFQGDRAAPAEGAAVIRTSLTFNAEREAIAGMLDAEGKRVFGRRLNVRVADAIETPEGDRATAAYDPAARIAYVAMRAQNPEGMRGSVWHEGLHHLRNAGAFTGADGNPNAAWRTLEREAKRWREQYNIEQRYGRDADENLLNEEAIAEALADYAQRGRGRETGFGPTVRMAFDRILRFFRQVANGMRGRGFQTWEDVFERDIASGRAGQRADALAGMTEAERKRYLQTAWTGSPAVFDEFDTGFIGSGEGNQAFGWGLYFSDAKAVAEHYRRTLAASNPVVTLKGKTYRNRSDLRKAMVDAGIKDESSAALAADTMFSMGKTPSLAGMQAAQQVKAAGDDQAAGLVNDWRYADELSMETGLGGAVYKVDLAPAEDEYLLWDKPYDKQSEKVKSALQNIGQERVNREGLDDSPLEALVPAKNLRNPENATGEGIYRAGAGIPFASQREVSMLLRKHGIRGIKYPAGSLGAAPAGADSAYNFVIFDDADVRIEEILLQRSGERWWHVSTAERPFARFDPDRIGKGEGKLDQGWGFYLSSGKPVSTDPIEQHTVYVNEETAEDAGLYTSGMDLVDIGFELEEQLNRMHVTQFPDADKATADPAVQAFLLQDAEVSVPSDVIEALEQGVALFDIETAAKPPTTLEGTYRYGEDTVLDLRAPIRGQSRTIQRAAARYGVSLDDNGAALYAAAGDLPTFGKQGERTFDFDRQYFPQMQKASEALVDEGIYAGRDDQIVVVYDPDALSLFSAEKKYQRLDVMNALLQRSEDTPAADKRAFDKAAKDWSGVDLKGAADAVIADKERMGGLSETIRVQLKGVKSVQAKNVEVTDVQDQADISWFMRKFAPAHVSTRNHKEVNKIILQGIRADENMANWTGRWNRRWNAITKPLKKEEFAELTGLLFLGDAEAHVFTDAELDQMKLPQRVRTAYRKSRQMLDKLGTMVNNHNRSMFLPTIQQRTRVVRRLAKASDMDLAEFRQKFQARAKLIKEQKAGDGDPEALAEQIDEATKELYGDGPTDEAHEKLIEEGDRLQTRIDDSDIKKRVGYVPHKFFGRWRVFRQTGTDAEGEPKWEHIAGEHGFWNSRDEAVRAASHMARKDPNIRMKVEPVEFVFPESQATQLSDAAYFRFQNNLKKLTGLQGQELQELVSGAARRRFRRRIAGFSQYRKGVEGFSKNLDRVMRTHIGETMRYIVLDRLKFDAINMMEKEGLSENRSTVWERPQLAQMVQQWFKDVNGQKQDAERAIDAYLDKSWMSPLKGGLAAGGAAFVASGGLLSGGAALTGAAVSGVGAVAVPVALGAYIGYRVGKGMAEGGTFKTRGITGGMLGDMSHLKLGMVLNVMTPAVNMYQVATNTYPVLGAKYTGVGIKRFEKAIRSNILGKPNADWRALERAGIGSMVNFAEGTDHQWRKESLIGKISLSIFTGTEVFNRGVSYLGALSKADAEGMDKPRAYAHSVMKRTQLNYEEAAKPEILRHKLWRVPLQFKNFVVQQLSFVFGLRGKEIPRFLTSMTLIAGALGLPFLDLFDDLTQWVTEKIYGKPWSPIFAMKEQAILALGQGELAGSVGTFLTRGAPGLAGVDMTGRVGMGDRFLPTQMTDFWGPWASTVKNAARHGASGANFVDQLRNVSPGIGNPLKNLESFMNGGVVTNPWKDDLVEYVATPGELALKAIGGRPMREARMQDIRDIERHRRQGDTQMKERYSDLIVRAQREGNRERARTLLREARDRGIRITPQSLRSRLSRTHGDRMRRELEALPRAMRERGREMREAVEGTAR